MAQEPLMREVEILELFKDQGIDNPKKVRKYALRLLSERTDEIETTLLKDILRADNPSKYVKDCLNRVGDCAILIEQFIEDGYHGMILKGNDVWPVKLKAPDHWLDGKERWAPDQEALLQTNAAEGWMKEHNRGYFHAKVVLFAHYGFSGVPNVLELKCTQDVEGLKRIPGTNYFHK